MKQMHRVSFQTRVTFSGNITRHPIYREYLNDYPNSDKIMSDGFLLGCHHGMAVEDVDYVCATMRRFFEVDAATGTAEQPFGEFRTSSDL